ncbi:hypothetical protein ACF08M_37640 [Streptomyces sp. NPDC015032]|uniref:hypothetical protein n=1 Tax=Streptomyces sp. NPDC015032 TaxID=3364937 RepID=UPI0037009004
MSTGVIALLVAVVGVVGTLLAPITTAWVSSRSRLQEFELQRRTDQVTRQLEDAQQNLERRRDIYVALNSGARRYRMLMMEDLHAKRTGAAPQSDATEAARVEFQATYAQAQMLIPDAVLEPSRKVRVALADARKLIGALYEDATHGQEEWQEAHTFLIQMWDVIITMQVAMRQDLGITQPPNR